MKITEMCNFNHCAEQVLYARSSQLAPTHPGSQVRNSSQVHLTPKPVFFLPPHADSLPLGRSSRGLKSGPDCSHLGLPGWKSLEMGSLLSTWGSLWQWHPKQVQCKRSRFRITVGKVLERILELCFSKLNVHAHHLRIRVKCSS